jgi:hypothetical protein
MIPDVTVPEGAKGEWKIERFTVPREPTIAGIRFALAGRAVYPGTYTRLVHKRRGVIMSDTPAEKRDHLYFIGKAQGHVLINGLGLGMCLAAVLAKPVVIKATVVEIDTDVIALVSPHYAHDPRVEIVHASAFDYQPPKDVRYGAVWHDIWDEISEENLPEMARLHRKYGRRTDWQASWGKDTIERQRRADRRRFW